MMNIGKETKITGLEKTGCTVGHIQQCLHDKNKHEEIKYSYCGRYVSRGTVVLNTCKGDFKVKFEEVSGWLKSLEIVTINANEKHIYPNLSKYIFIHYANLSDFCRVNNLKYRQVHDMLIGITKPSLELSLKLCSITDLPMDVCFERKEG